MAVLGDAANPGGLCSSHRAMTAAAVRLSVSATTANGVVKPIENTTEYQEEKEEYRSLGG